MERLWLACALPMGLVALAASLIWLDLSPLKAAAVTYLAACPGAGAIAVIYSIWLDRNDGREAEEDLGREDQRP